MNDETPLFVIICYDETELSISIIFFRLHLFAGGSDLSLHPFEIRSDHTGKKFLCNFGYILSLTPGGWTLY
jgi:hypothetical protein